jgi:hypothetical protein
MKLYRLFCCIVFSVSFLSAAEEPGGPWKEERSDENLSIFSREVPGTDIREVKATALMPGTIKEAVDIIFDRKNHPGNMPYITKSVVISKDDRCDVSYNIISPPVASNRDYIVRSCADKASSQETKLWWETATHKDYPENDDNVRVKVNKGYYIFRQIEPDKLLVDYYIYTDPGGSLPIFVKNIANRTGVSDVLESLEKTIQKRRKK